MSRNSYLILAFLALALFLIIPLRIVDHGDAGATSRDTRAGGQSERSAFNQQGARTPSKSGPGLMPLRDMLPPGAILVEGDFAQANSDEPIVIIYDKVRMEAAGARSHREGIMLKAPFRMVGLTEEREKDWAMESEAGYVYLDRSGEQVLSESVEGLVFKQEDPLEIEQVEALP